MNSEIPIIGKKKEFCKICGMHKHPFNTRCDYNQLVGRIKLLSDTNAMIPGILAANKEATEVATALQILAKQTSSALLLCEKTVLEFENGPKIWKKFQERLEEAWAKGTFNQGTEEAQASSSPRNTTQSEIGSKPSIAGTVNGETTAPSSLL